MLRPCVIYLKGNWDYHLPLIEFAYNYSKHLSMGISQFEAIYRRRCRPLIGRFEIGEFCLIGLKIVYEVVEKVQLLRYKLNMD